LTSSLAFQEDLLHLRFCFIHDHGLHGHEWYLGSCMDGLVKRDQWMGEVS
jgi:hypothetical protein